MKPNVLIFMVDEMPYDVTKADSPCRLPTIQKLAQDGLRLQSCYTPSPHCCPSRATFMTGKYPSEHGIWNNVNTVTAHNHNFHDGIGTFSEHLRDAGYGMYFSGKWHASLNKRPRHFGWEEIGKVTPDDHIRKDNNDLKRFEKFAHPGKVTMKRPGWGDLSTSPYPYEKQEASGEYGNDHAQEGSGYYKNAIVPAVEKLKNLGRETPWCMFVSTDMNPYDIAKKEYLDRIDIDSVPLPANYKDTLKDKPNCYQRLKAYLWNQLSEREMKESIRNYWALCMQEDAYLKMLLDALDLNGQAEDTVVLFLSDHGDYNGAHGLQFMGVPAFREAYHVPAVMRWPAGIKNPGRNIDEIVSLADFAPTFLELGEVKEKPAMSGSSLVPFLMDQKPAHWRDAMCSQFNGNEVYYTQRAVWTKDWKYVYNAFDFDEMYDLAEDPHEMVNLIHPSRLEPMPDADPSENPWPPLPADLNKKRRELMAKIWDFAFKHDDMCLNPFPPVAMASFGPGIVGE